MKKVIGILLTVAMVISLVACGTGKSKAPKGEKENGTENPTANEETVQNYENSSAENDTDLGLRTIKIDSAAFKELSADRQLVIEYFDDDYLSVPDYDFLRRYPAILQDAQLTIWGTVTDVISWTPDTFELILYMNIGPAEYEYEYEDNWAAYGGGEILVTGESSEVAYMEGDTIEIYGRFVGIENTTVDGQSYTIPHIVMQKALYDDSSAPQDIYRYIPKFDYNFIKNVATVIFGEDIEVREPIVGTDITEMQYAIWEEVNGAMPCYVVELENQSNAKFSKYFFFTDASTDAYGGNRIEVASDAMGYSDIYRAIEFSADFSHYFLFTYDQSLGNLTLEYYDLEFNKLWKREFSETTSANYDYTKNNIYLVANNELYIINTETGEDTFSPAYVGEKVAIRKLSDGILLISKGKSDGIMKVGLDGEIIWKTNLADDTYDAGGIQIVGNNIVAMQYYLNTNAIGDPVSNGYHYLLINNESGEIIQDAKVETYNSEDFSF